MYYPSEYNFLGLFIGFQVKIHLHLDSPSNKFIQVFFFYVEVLIVLATEICWQQIARRLNLNCLVSYFLD